MRLQDIRRTHNRSATIHGAKGRTFCFGDRLWHTGHVTTEDLCTSIAENLLSLFLSPENSASDLLLVLPHNSVKSRRRWAHNSSGKQDFPFPEPAASISVWWVLIVFSEKAVSLDDLCELQLLPVYCTTVYATFPSPTLGEQVSSKPHMLICWREGGGGGENFLWRLKEFPICWIEIDFGETHFRIPLVLTTFCCILIFSCVLWGLRKVTLKEDREWKMPGNRFFCFLLECVVYGLWTRCLVTSIRGNSNLLQGIHSSSICLS